MNIILKSCNNQENNQALLMGCFRKLPSVHCNKILIVR